MDRIHSRAVWGVQTKSGQKCNTLYKIVVCRELIKSVQLSEKRTDWVSDVGLWGDHGGTKEDQGSARGGASENQKTRR